ncbi:MULTISPECIES: type II secretion system F family protein [Cryobacterium]|uniref:type II secretion system F family protein n=1 Tax=Cryobacterium TaxID=69578 RepID=UPI000CD3FE5D|nr:MULTISPECIES: type II secretion system F family protein [Cryobacterium]POH68481.1 type II secretion system F family protein [Cryobacterium zongtaii]TFC49166.1 type II secretion system F family protein [Cryobacterium sp. TMN-39-2]
MPSTQAYAYKGRDAAGRIVKGRVDASSELAVTSRLRTMGLTPISIAEASAGTGLNREINIGGFRKRVKLADLAIMSRQMATMISSGLSLLRTLNILAEQTESKALADILGKVRSDVETGSALSDAMQQHAEDFPPLMINMVRAGETGGFLENSLTSIADSFEADVKLRGTIKSALTYPVIVLIMAIVAVAAMLIFIVPVFKGMFEGLGGTLPLPTQMLVWLSEMMIYIVPVVVIGSVFFTVWWHKNRHTERVRKVIDPLKLKLPVFGPLMTKIAVARFTRNFSAMIGAGVPILKALQIVGETSGSWVVEMALRNVAESVRQGKSIAGPLANEPIFPAMVTQMIAVGEDSGSLEQMLGKIADFYDAEVESTTEQLTSLIEPLMVAFIGVVVGGMIVALYLPVFDIFKLIE